MFTPIDQVSVLPNQRVAGLLVRLLLALTMKNLALLATNLRDDVLRLAVAEAVRLQSVRCQQQKTEETQELAQ